MTALAHSPISDDILAERLNYLLDCHGYGEGHYNCRECDRLSAIIIEANPIFIYPDEPILDSLARRFNSMVADHAGGHSNCADCLALTEIRSIASEIYFD